MSSTDPLVDARKPIPSNLLNMISRRAEVRYTISSTISPTNFDTTLLPAGSIFPFLKYYTASQLRLEGWIEWHRILSGGTVGRLTLGVRMTSLTTGSSTDQDIGHSCGSALANTIRTSAVRIRTFNAQGMYTCQPYWRASLVSGGAEATAGYTFGVHIREVYGA